MQRLDTMDDETYWKIALTGNGGTGKTTLGVSAPKPLILLSERQGYPSIKQAAKRLGKPVPPVIYVDAFDDYRRVLSALHGDKSKQFIVQNRERKLVMALEEWPETVVIDSLTDAMDLLKDEIRKVSPPRPGRDNLPVDAQRFWNTLIDRATGMIKGYRDAPVNVVWLCLLSDKPKEDENGNIIERILQPKLATKDMPQTLCAAVNVMGYTYRTSDPKTKLPVYGVMTIGPDGMLTKPCEPLGQFEAPDLSNWIERLNGNIVDVPKQPAVPDMMLAHVVHDEADPESSTPVAPEDPGLPDVEPPPEVMCSACGEEAVAVEGDICSKCEDEAFGKGEEAS